MSETSETRPRLDASQFDHVGIPTEVEWEGAAYLPDDGVWITNPRQHPANVEWVRHTEASRMPEPIKTRPHIAYRVDELEPFLAAYKVLAPPFVIPESGVRVAFVEVDGVITELMAFANRDQEEWVV